MNKFVPPFKGTKSQICSNKKQLLQSCCIVRFFVYKARRTAPHQLHFLRSCIIWLTQIFCQFCKSQVKLYELD